MTGWVHATCVGIGPRGVLIRGPSGSGKSDLALRMIVSAGAPALDLPPACLVADDQVDIRSVGGVLEARAPKKLAGVLEVRGVAPIALPHVSPLPLHLIVDLVHLDDVPRLPQAYDSVELDGQRIRRIKLAPFEASATAKVYAAVAMLAR